MVHVMKHQEEPYNLLVLTAIEMRRNWISVVRYY